MTGFKEIREHIDSLIDETKSWIKKKSIHESMSRLEKANEQLQTAKVFKSGNRQAIRLPKDFQVRGSEVFIKKVGGCVIIIPKGDPWKIVEESIPKFTDDIFEKGREQILPQEREGSDDLYA